MVIGVPKLHVRRPKRMEKLLGHLSYIILNPYIGLINLDRLD